MPSPPRTGLYNPKALLTHAAWLRQGFPHCAKFPTAASRRSLDRVSVPVWLIALSDQLPIVGLVGCYPTNYLMGREPISRYEDHEWLPHFAPLDRSRGGLSGISRAFALLSRAERQVTHVLLTRAPL